jgi:hypothetical protein
VTTTAELASALGHANVEVRPGFQQREWYARCDCGKITAVRALKKAAIDDAVHHVRVEVERFTLEAKKAGLTVEQALEARNGKIRIPHNGRIVLAEDRHIRARTWRKKYARTNTGARPAS